MSRRVSMYDVARPENHYLVHTSAYHVDAIRNALNIGIGNGRVKGFIEDKLDKNEDKWTCLNAKVCYFVAAKDADDAEDGDHLRHYPNVLRHVGRLANLYPQDNPRKGLEIDEIIDMVSAFRSSFSKNMDQKAGDRMLIHNFRIFDDLIEENIKKHGNPVLVGDKLTIADLEVNALVSFLENPRFSGQDFFHAGAFYQEFIHVKKMRKAIHNHPSLLDAYERERVHKDEVKAGKSVAGEASSFAYLKKAGSQSKRQIPLPPQLSPRQKVKS